MKILVVANYYYPEHTGGVEIVSHNLVKHYREFDCEVRWVAADVPPRFRNALDGDIPIRAWNYTEEKLGFPCPLPYSRDLLKLVDCVRWCDVVHLQDCLYPINIIVFLISKAWNRPLLITQYAKFIPYRQHYKRMLQTLAYHTVGWLMFSMADRVVFITQNVRDNMRYLNPKKLHEVVPLGVDTDFYSPISPAERTQMREKLSGNSVTPIILFVGRMVERKGVHLIRSLIEKHTEWHWILVGRPDDFNPGEWQLPNLTYFQFVSDNELHKLHASADLLVHPSFGEGITLTALESLASGTPVLISEESLYDVQEQDRDLFFAVKLDSNSIEENILRALSDREKLEDLRARCRDYALNHLSWKKMVERYVSILNALLHPRNEKELQD